MNDSQNTQVDILDLLAALRAGIKLIIIGTLVVCAISGIVSLFLEEEYEGLVQLLPPKEQKKGFGFADLLADLPIIDLTVEDPPIEEVIEQVFSVEKQETDSAGTEGEA